MKKINRYVKKKSNVVYIIIIAVWILCLLHFNPKLFGALTNEDPLYTKIIFLFFVAFLDLFWLYGIFHIVFLFYRFLKDKIHTIPRSSSYPSVAILYATRNDFQAKAVESCLRQSYPNYHVYILDDSTEPEYLKAIDRFWMENPKRCSIVRRKDRQGFKAGNLNNALRNHALEHDYFAVIDADEVIPEEFLSKMMPYFAIDESIAFVQANHEHNPEQPSKFAQDLSAGIDFHWDIYQRPRNRHGFVIFYGHGAVIRRDVWEKAGGFPEIVSEDLAFSTRVRQMGFRGYFVREVKCYEDFPETYLQFRKRQEKWVQGACEYLHREFLPFLFSRRVTFAEKMDVFLSLFALFIPAIFLAYLFVANAFLPMLLADQYTLSMTVFGKTFNLMPVYFFEPRFKNLWTLDFYFITILGMFSPMLCYLPKVFTQPIKIGRLLLKSTVPYISLILVSSCGIFKYIFTRKAVFLATGDQTTGCRTLGNLKAILSIKQLHANNPLIFHCEWILGLILSYFSLVTKNFALLTISSCLILSPMIVRYKWENRAVSFLVSLPLFFVLLTFSGIGLGFMGIQGFSLCFLTFHF